jgi:hypothetical protein
VINDDTFVAERITGEDFSMKKDASKYVMEHNLEESTPGDEYESLDIRPPHVRISDRYRLFERFV